MENEERLSSAMAPTKSTEEWQGGIKGFLARFARFGAIAEAAAIEDD
jgi:hypothetical protein